MPNYYDAVYKTGNYYSAASIAGLPNLQIATYIVKLEEIVNNSPTTDYKAVFVDSHGHEQYIEYGDCVIRGYTLTGPQSKRKLELTFENPMGALRKHEFYANISNIYSAPVNNEWNPQNKYKDIFEYLDAVNEAGYDACETISNLKRCLDRTTSQLTLERELHNKLKEYSNTLAHCIEELNVPEGETELRLSSAINLPNLKRVFLPSSIKVFDFANCGSLVEEIWCKALKPPTIIHPTLTDAHHITLFVPKVTFNVYVQDEQFDPEQYTIRGVVF